MATQPPPEFPEPSQPGMPDAPPPEVSPPSPDVDIPSPGEQPTGPANPQG
jgi:hypothetical protein